MSNTVIVTQHDGWAEIRIAREEKRNAMDRASRRALTAAFDELRGKAKAIVITGTGKSFCAGIDLKEADQDVARLGPEAVNVIGEEWTETNLAIRSHPAIFIAAVNGVSLGGGSTMINICDLAIASTEASIGCPEISFATYPAMAGPAVQLAGLTRKQAAWMVLTGNRIDGSTAAAWGMVNECVLPEDLLPRAHALASQLARYDAAALAESKKALDLIPASVTDWRKAMDQGLSVNALIRSRSAAAAERWSAKG
jgi:enoyl-CoA hydratase/carnithine racemase